MTQEKVKGNTRLSRGRRWMLTINNYEKVDVEKLLTQELYCFQEEVGKEGVKHLQCFLEYSNARSFKSIKDKWPRAHIEKAKNRDRSIRYCQKSDSRCGKSYCNIPGYKIIEDKFLLYKPKNWQSAILRLIGKKPDDRKVFWFYDEIGGIGKSVFCKHLILRHNALVISGSKRDIKYAISEQIRTKDLDIVVIDISRSEYNNVSYSAIENIKNGFFFSGKYESGMCVFNTPHVIVFANESPERSRMSMDRWKVFHIK